MRAGQPLDDAHLLPEISILFIAGFESAHSCPFLPGSPSWGHHLSVCMRRGRGRLWCLKSMRMHVGVQSPY